MTIWKDARELGRNAAEIAIKLAGGAKLAEIPKSASWDQMPLKREDDGAVPDARARVTKDNLNVVIDAGWAPKSAICQGVARWQGQGL